MPPPPPHVDPRDVRYGADPRYAAYSDPYYEDAAARHRVRGAPPPPRTAGGYYDYYDSPNYYHPREHHGHPREGRERSYSQDAKDRVYKDEYAPPPSSQPSETSVHSKSGEQESLHAVSSSFSNEGKSSAKGMGSHHGSVTKANETPGKIAVKQSPGVVTHGSGSSSIGSSKADQPPLPSQPSLKSNPSNEDNEANSTTSDSSWRQLQQIASIDKEEMMRLQTSKSEITAVGTSPRDDQEEEEVNKSDDKTPSKSKKSSSGDATPASARDGAVEQATTKAVKQESPGDLKEVPSTLSRTSSLSNSPTDDDQHHHHHHSGRVRHEGEQPPPRDEHNQEYHRYPQSSYHHYGHHPHGRVSHPPPHLHPIGHNGGDVNNEDNSPSASTISTKASLLGQNLHYQHHPQSQFFNEHPPTPNMKPKHPVHVKKSREEGGESKRRKLSDTSTDAKATTAHDNDDKNNINNGPSPTGSASSEGGLEVLSGAASKKTHVALDGRVMAESPSTGAPNNSNDSTAGASHHSNHSLELGAMPSWETAGKPLAGWSVCSGMTEMGSLAGKDGVLSAFSFSEGFKSDGGGAGGAGSGKEEARDDSSPKGDEQDPSPKSILSKSGEKRKSLAPGVHVQFSREAGGASDGYPPSLEVSTSTSTGGSLRKRSHGMVARSAPPPPHHPHDEYYYDYPRHPGHPYDYPGRPGMPPPPMHHHPGPRHPREHAYYPEEDPYYDHYYGHHPPPPYGYPPHPRGASRGHPRGPPPPHYAEYPPPPSSHHHSSRPRSSVSTIHSPPETRTIHRPPPGSSSSHHHPAPVPSSQFSHMRNGSSSSVSGWDKEDDMHLMEIMKKFKNPKNWEPIARKLNRGKSPSEVQDRWTRYLKPGSRKGQWTDEEDAIVIDTVQNSAEEPFTRWSELAQKLPGRVGKQVRDRWVNHLNPAINHLPFSRDDDLLLWDGHHMLGKRWVEISSKYFKGTRSENHIKNRWYSASFKKFIAKEFGPDAYRIGNDNAGSGGRKVHQMNGEHPGTGPPIISGHDHSKLHVV